MIGSFIADTFDFSMGKQDWHAALFAWLNYQKGLDLFLDDSFLVKAIQDELVSRELYERFAKLIGHNEFGVHGRMPSAFEMRRRGYETGGKNLPRSMINQIMQIPSLLLTMRNNREVFPVLLKDFYACDTIEKLERIRTRLKLN